MNKPVIVLVRPQLGQNIGKAARAMLNFGLTEMRLVAPRDGWPNPDAGPAASGADVVLERAKVFQTVAEAIADCNQVFASTVRRRDLVMPVLGPQEMADEIAALGERSAILFGPERSGLETEDVALASAIVTVPINPEFGSLNLAQAVILLAYEWSRRSALAQPPAKELEPVGAASRDRRSLGTAERRASLEGLFPPALTHSGDQEHHSYDIHQDRLVIARSQSRSWNHPGARRSAAGAPDSAGANLTLTDQVSGRGEILCAYDVRRCRRISVHSPARRKPRTGRWTHRTRSSVSASMMPIPARISRARSASVIRQRSGRTFRTSWIAP